VIGLDVLSLSNFSINYTTKRIVFGVTPVSGFSIPLQGTPPWLIVRMEVDGVSLICCSTLQRQASALSESNSGSTAATE
jgi:hypothetical protein